MDTIKTTTELVEVARTNGKLTLLNELTLWLLFKPENISKDDILAFLTKKVEEDL